MNNIWSIIFLVFAGQGVFIALFLFWKKSSYKKANIFLGLLLLLFSYELLEDLAVWTSYILEIPNVSATSAGFMFLYGPVVYFFMLFRIKTDYKFRLYDLLHLIPFVYFTYYIRHYYRLPSEYKVHFLRDVMIEGNSGFNNEVCLCVLIASGLMIGYSLMSFFLARKAGRMNSFLKKTMALFFIFGVSFAIYYFVTLNYNTGIYADAIHNGTLVLLIYLIAFHALSKPNFFDATFYQRKSNIKYKNSNLTIEDSNEYLRKIKFLMIENELYLNRNLKIQEVANKLNIHTNQVSQVLNQIENKSFVEFINYYRVERAMKLLVDGTYHNYTIEAIASESGFNNRASFNNYFKKHTSLTPNEFKSKFS